MEFKDLRNALNAEVIIFIGKIVEIKDLIGGEVEEGIDTLEGNILKARIRTGFLFCPRYGLRIPEYVIVQYYGGYCPCCGSSTVKMNLHQNLLNKKIGYIMNYTGKG